MKTILVLFLRITGLSTNDQVGIGTNAPKPSALLDGNADNLPANAQKAYMPPTRTQTERDGITSHAEGLVVCNTKTNRPNFWSGTECLNFNGSSAKTPSMEDVKQGFQKTYHDGWVKLNGRALSTLSASQQTKAKNFGFTTNLPDATNSFFVQNVESLGAASGSNAKTMEQASIPNYNFPTATTSASGNHSHSVRLRRTNQNFAGGNGNVLNFTTSMPINISTTPNVNHSHTVTVNSGGIDVPLDITPKSLSVNTFIYLGT